MAFISFRASAPGSLMLLGEHAVLHGRDALVCALDRRLTAELIPRSDRGVRIESSFGIYENTLDALPADDRLRFVLAVVEQLLPRLERGFTLRLESQLSAVQGLGSSAAATVATAAVLRRWLGMGNDPEELLPFCRRMVIDVQGAGSGADVAASVYGGVVHYRGDPPLARPLRVCPPLAVVYCGYKTPTVEVIARVEAARRAAPARYDALFTRMGEAARLGADAMQAGDFAALGDLLNKGQEVMEGMELSTPELDAIVNTLRAHPAVYGAKISGSGLGDCAVGLGCMQPWHGPGELLAVQSGAMGVRAGHWGQ